MLLPSSYWIPEQLTAVPAARPLFPVVVVSSLALGGTAPGQRWMLHVSSPLLLSSLLASPYVVVESSSRSTQKKTVSHDVTKEMQGFLLAHKRG